MDLPSGAPDEPMHIEDDICLTLQQILKQDVQPTHQQRTAITSLCQGQSVMYIDRTGAGKSETYFVVSKLLRQQNPRHGPVIVLSPLTSLMRDQVARCKASGVIRADVIHKDVSQVERASILGKAARNELDILFLTVEMIAYFSENPTHAIPTKLPQLKINHTPNPNFAWDTVPLVVIDEIHYISEVGYSFRPYWKKIWRDLEAYPWWNKAPKLGLTATFNQRVGADISGCMPHFTSWQRVEGEVFRKNLSIRIISGLTSRTAKETWLCKFILETASDHNILIFVQSIEEGEVYLKAILKASATASVVTYNAKLPKDRKDEIETGFRSGSIRVVISTLAMGLGFDKADIHDVVHTYTPSKSTQYYQEIGRAGRNPAQVPKARAFLLTSQPWASTGWIHALQIIARHLASVGKDKTENVREQLVRRNTFARDIEESITTGCQHKIFQESGDDGDTTLELLEDWQKKLEEMKTYIENIKIEMKAMLELNDNKTCSWRTLLRTFDGEMSNCGNCSAPCCTAINPEGNDNLQVTTWQTDQLFFKTTTSTQLDVYGLGSAPEGDADLDIIRIQALLGFVFHDIPASPPAYALGWFPDSGQKNKKTVEFISNELGIPMVQVATLGPSKEKVREANALSEKKRIADQKYQPPTTHIPPGFKAIIIFDDVLHSGSTLNRLASFVAPTHVIGLVGTIYPSENRKTERFVIPKQ